MPLFHHLNSLFLYWCNNMNALDLLAEFAASVSTNKNISADTSDQCSTHSSPYRHGTTCETTHGFVHAKLPRGGEQGGNTTSPHSSASPTSLQCEPSRSICPSSRAGSTQYNANGENMRLFREQQFHQSLTHHCEVSHYTSAEPAELRPKSLPNTHYEYNHSAQSVEQSWIPMERQLPNFPPLLMSNNEPLASFCICGDTNCHQQYKPAYYHPVPNGYIPAYEGIQRPSEQGYSRAFTGNYRA